MPCQGTHTFKSVRAAALKHTAAHILSCFSTELLYSVTYIGVAGVVST